MPLLFAQLRERLGRAQWKDVSIVALSLSLVAMSAYAFRDQISKAKAKLQAGAQGGETVSVFDVLVDREGRQYVDILFDRPLGEGLQGEVLSDAPATLDPALGGSWRWQDTNALRFSPSGGFPVASTYTIELIPERLLRPGQVFSGDTEIKVVTDRFLVSGVDLDEEIAGKAKIALRGTLKFNYAVDPEVLVGKVRIEDSTRGADSPVEIQFDTYYSTSSIEFHTGPIDKQPNERKIRLVVSKELTPTEGSVPLGEDWSHEIEIGSSIKLVVRDVSSTPGANESTINVRFSSPVAAAVAEKYLTFEPAVPFELSESGTTLTVSGPFEPGKSYTMKLAKGLPATDDSSLQAEFESKVSLPDLDAEVDFQSQGMFLSASGNKTIAIQTTNVPKFTLAIDRVYKNNLFFLFEYGGFFEDEFAWGDSGLDHALGDRLSDETIDVRGPKNKPIATPITIDRHIPKGERGLYRVVVGQPDEYEGRQRWILITDLGAVAKRAPGEFLVWVSSLADLAPAVGAKVTLISDQNQTMGTGVTDGAGLWRFRDAAALADRTPYMVMIEKGSDWTFLRLEDMAIDTTGLDVGGAEPAGEGYDAYLYGERDLYRPGEKLEGLAIVRDGSLQAAPAGPAQLRWRDPQGRERGVQRAAIDARGLATFALDIPAFATTGRHTLEFEVAKKVIGTYSFQVEEFVPDRIKVEIAGKDGAAAEAEPGAPLAVKVSSHYLFGPPAAGLAVESRIRLVDAPFTPKGLEAYTWRNDERKLEDREILSAEGKLDADGKAEFSALIPEGIPVPSSLEAVVTARVQEQGGRGVTALQRLPVHPYPVYLGLKRPRPDAFAEPGKDETFEWIAVAPNGKEKAAGALRAELIFDRWNTVLRKTASGSYRWESTRNSVLAATLPIAAGKSRGTFKFRPREYGSYRVVVSDASNTSAGASTSIEFYASGWGYSPWAIKNPARLEIDLDKTEYAPGETASVQIRSPFPGKVLLTVEREGVFHLSVHEMKGNTAKIPLAIDGAWRPNAYVTATVVRRARDLEPGGSGRAFGAVPIAVDREANRLAPQIAAPAEVRPESRLELEVTATPGSVVTIAAVDEGILQLIAQKTPQPFEFFYRKLALAVDSYDSFAVLLPEVKPEGAAQKGGGDGVGGRGQYVRTDGLRRVKPVAFWSGPLTADASGRVRVGFRVPEFQGALRLMAVSADGRRFGSAEKVTRVRTPIALLPTYPRVLSYDETLSVPITVRNDTGRAGSFRVALAASGAQSVEPAAQQVQLGNAAESTVYFAVETGGKDGEVRFTATATGNGETSRSTANVPVRADLFPITTEQAGGIDRDELKLPLDDDGLREDTVRRKLRISPLPLVQFSGKLGELLRYPYGCAEQTVSTAFPLLYLGDLAKELEPELFDPKNERGDPAAMVQAGIRRLGSMQIWSGGFSLWPGGENLAPWPSVYIAHFLVEARRAGHPVEDFLYDHALAWIRGDAKAKTAYGQDEIQRTAYELYVLARAGQADLGTMDFLRDKHAKSLRPESRALLAAAYASVGNRAALGHLLSGLAEVEQVARQSGGNFNSPIRNRALVLLALLEAEPQSPRITTLVDRLARDARESQVWNTQESGFAFVALGQFFKRQQSAPPYSGTVWLGGKRLGTFDNRTTAFVDIQGDDTLRIEMADGYKAGGAFYSVTTRAIPTDKGFRPAAEGLEIERTALDRNGQTLDLSRVEQGDLIVFKTRVRSTSGPIQNVVLVSLLPSGLEIENPRLESTEQLPWATDANFRAASQDLRDDRVIFFTDLPANSWQTIYTLVRAVAPGKFRLPPPQAEAMYNPAIRAVGGRGEIVVEPRK